MLLLIMKWPTGLDRFEDCLLEAIFMASNMDGEGQEVVAYLFCLMILPESCMISVRVYVYMGMVA